MNGNVMTETRHNHHQYVRRHSVRSYSLAGLRRTSRVRYIRTFYHRPYHIDLKQGLMPRLHADDIYMADLRIVLPAAANLLSAVDVRVRRWRCSLDEVKQAATQRRQNRSAQQTDRRYQSRLCSVDRVCSYRPRDGYPRFGNEPNT